MQFIKVKTLKEAVQARERTSYAILAGGTDILAQWRSGAKKPEGVIEISGINAIKKIKECGDDIEIGALATHSDIKNSPLVQRYVPALALACATVGALQIQNAGTIGGNVMNASPAGDTLPVLLAYDALVEIYGPKGKRRVPFGKFYSGYRKTCVEKNEMVSKFIISKAYASARSDFYKVGTRRAQAISKVCACFVVNGGKYAISFGSVAPTPIRCFGTERFLEGKALDGAVIDEAVRMVASEVAPIDDIRSTAAYRRRAAGALLGRFLKKKF